MAEVTVALIQMSASDSSEKNIERAIDRLHQVIRQGAQIVCFQELFRTPYFCQSEDPENFRLAETIPGPTTQTLSKIAKRESVVIIAPLFEKRTSGIYHNSAVVIDADGRIAGTYRKMHIPDDPRFYEKFYFTPGDLGFTVCPTRYARIGVLICWDQWFPEAARISALGGAEILFYPAAIGWHQKELPEVRNTQRMGWEIVQRGHAVANEVFVAVCNRVGQEGDLIFWGNSFMADPFGAIVAQAGDRGEENVLAVCDLGKIEEVRQNWPFLRDRRIDAYGDITKRFLDQKGQGPVSRIQEGWWSQVTRWAKDTITKPISKP
ncbi:MAG: carbon-nitrogen hydrolase [Candidatus Omnitrophica bacterium]|nr:carbon-nitrogen hydrolase [Candidatus Omnitrophota bacterium]